MFYKQTINNIKVVILSLDGGLLDLNRLRFNYFKRICKTHNFELTKDIFEEALGNMKTMYNDFPISKDINPDDINKLIERDLYEYAKLKPETIKKEGTDELLQFFKQKEIKIAVVSTHKTKRAIQYLQLTRLYDKVDFVIGGDSDNLPLPDTAVLKTTLEQMNCKPSEAIVIANYPNLLYAANQCLINVIYLSDLCLVQESIGPRVFKIARNNLEIINIFLFARYDTMEIFSPLLGMSSDMDIETLDKTYAKLLEEYQNDQQLIELVRNTYHYFLGEIANREADTVNTSLFEDEDVIVAPVDDEHFSNPQSIATLEKSIEEVWESEEVSETDNEIADTVFKRENLYQDDEFSKTRTAIGCDPERVNELMDIINGNSGTKLEEGELFEKSNDEILLEKRGLLSYFINFVYTVIVVGLISFLGLIIFIGFEDFIQRPGIVAGIIKSIIDFYVNLVLSIYAVIFNSLNALLSFIPDYSSLIAGNGLLSTMAVKLVLFIIFNVIIVYIVKMIYLLITEAEEDDANFAED